MKIKEKWPEIKDRLINALKFNILVLTMIMGIWFILAILWFSIGLPQTTWAMWILFALSVIAEWFYIKWVSN